ncbi:MAG: bacterial-like globin family protein [Bacteroidetes bacterium]|nr:bacterial-like globin family protein [Bacteroidota bacterium]
MTKEILNKDDIKQLVDAFYLKVREDGLLAGIFNSRIKDNWPLHLEKMYSFWESLLLDKVTYHGNPFAHHADLPVDKEHFDRWLALFGETVDELFEGAKAGEAKSRAAKIAAIFQTKIENMRKL